MEKIAAWGPIVTGGIFAATLSSALASLVGAPKTFQALCKDKIFPGIDLFGVGVSIQLKYSQTVLPVSGHPWDQKKCPVRTVVRLCEVKSVVFLCDCGQD